MEQYEIEKGVVIDNVESIMIKKKHSNFTLSNL